MLERKGVFIRGLSTESFRTEVIVMDYSNDVILEFDSMGVKLSDHNIYVRVDVMWEDNGLPRYKDYNLYGYYSTSYVDMEYIDDTQELLICDNNNKILIKSP